MRNDEEFARWRVGDAIAQIGDFLTEHGDLLEHVLRRGFGNVVMSTSE